MSDWISDVGSSDLHTSGGAGTAPRWLRLVRAGNLVTASASVDGTTWTVVGSATIALPSTALVGFAVSSHDATQTGRASCRERVCQYVEISVGAVSLTKKQKVTTETDNK